MIQCSADTQRLVQDLAEEYDNEITDGLLTTLSKQEDENDAFNLLKNHGYDIPYDEFKSIYQNIETILGDYVELLHSLPIEGDVIELSETALENVTGGISNGGRQKNSNNGEPFCFWDPHGRVTVIESPFSFPTGVGGAIIGQPSTAATGTDRSTSTGFKIPIRK
jgi:hypothetical protein